MKRWMRVAMLAGLSLVAGCRRHRMTPDECNLVLDRIVELELAERGFRDPLLAKRRQSDLRGRFSADLAGCEGRRVASAVSACVQKATSAEEISHVCLR
jgi:hypothetical protein